MTLKILREHYGKTSGFMTLVSVFFLTVVTAMAVLIADEATLAGEDSGMSFNIFNITFILGMFLIVFSLASGFVAFKNKSEAGAAFTRLSAAFNTIIGVFFSGDIIYMLVSKKAIWSDQYTRNIFLISLTAGVLLVIYSAFIFIFSIKARSYYDRKKSARELPDITTETINHRYYGIMNISYCIFMMSVWFMSYFYNNQITEYYRLNREEVQWQAGFFNIVFITGVVITGISFVMGILFALNIKIPKFKTIVIVLTSALLLLAVIFIVISFTMIGSAPVKAGFPDISYMLFAYAVIIIAAFMAKGVFKAE